MVTKPKPSGHHLKINSFNCWEIPQGQSAAKTFLGKVQRLSKVKETSRVQKWKWGVPL